MTLLPSPTPKFYSLVEELKALGSPALENPLNDELYQRFIQSFPPSRLKELTVSEYCVGKGGRDSFCWWIERGLQLLLGRYTPGTSRGHVMYFLPDGTLYKHRDLKALSDDSALQYTLKIQEVIASAEQHQDLHWIDDDNELYKRANVGLHPLY